PRLNKEDLIATAHKAWDERRGGRGVRLVGLHVTLLYRERRSPAAGSPGSTRPARLPSILAAGPLKVDWN
ncbi:hypothetical protein PRR77_17795, partial [Klebsiella pneumoniae]|nr:hypothetical protein [Klebsiella pneumoniae]